MAADTDFASSLLRFLPPLGNPSPPKAGPAISISLPPPPPLSLSHPSSLSEASLVRLALNALQGLRSSLISVQKLSSAFCCDAADRTFHQIPSLWSRSSSTHALGNVLDSVGRSGILVFLLGKFVDHFNNVPYSLVNQAFAVAVGKVVEGYMCSLDTLCASARLRRRDDSSLSPRENVGCVSSVVHSELTLLEVYLHTKELMTRIESLANICDLYKFRDCFAKCCFDEMLAEAENEFCGFYRVGDLLTYLYTQLQVAHPVHRPVLKFLFLRTCEPYFGFIRSWIFKAEIYDPYEEFLVEYVQSQDADDQAGNSIDFPLATIREREGVPVPCFLKDFLVPLFRACLQRQILIVLKRSKLLDLFRWIIRVKIRGNSGFLCGILV